jgi:hypothetical protein
MHSCRKKLVNFRVGVEIISSHIPNRSSTGEWDTRDPEQQNDRERTKRRKLLRFKCKNDKKIAFLSSMIDVMSLAK